ncbi:hypothetical protein BD414DRAFT_211541 [Trametes punicea]|nr:hypothetical protein BD414DRAFT_211541 [Trametes punicea]
MDYGHAGLCNIAKAREAMVLCARALRSPQILQSVWASRECSLDTVLGSGVRPKEDLQVKGVPVVHVCLASAIIRYIWRNMLQAQGFLRGLNCISFALQQDHIAAAYL